MAVRSLTLFIVFLGVIPSIAPGQTLVNPDISAIVDMRYVGRNDVAAELADAEELSFEFHELELAATGYLNPYMRGDLFLAIHGVSGPFEVEEAYGSVVRGLPVQLRFGKYLVDFGKINTQHPHQWGWLDRPLMHRTVWGPDGAGVIGLGVSRLQPVGDTAVTLSLSAFRSDFFAVPELEHEHEDSLGTGDKDEHDHAHGGEGKTDISASGRLSLFRSFTENSHVELGGAGMYGRYDSEHELDAALAGVDFKYRWRPSTYTSFNLIVESLYSEREVSAHEPEETPANRGNDEEHAGKETVTAWGAFSAAEFQFRRRYDIGLYYDWTQDAYVQNAETTGYGGYAGFMPVEDTARFSLVYRFEESDFYEGTSHSVTFQVLWSLGPHKPHPF
jgi:hypothetical protein